MIDLTFYGLGSCDTCRKALKDLRAAGIEPSVIDVRSDGIPEKDLSEMVSTLGAEPLVNRRSTTWRGLSLEDRDRAMVPATCAKVLAENPTLMKRPVIVAGGTFHVGWNAEVKAQLTE